MPAGSLREQLVELPGSNAGSVSGKATNKETKSGEKNTSAAKKEPKTKLAFVQTALEPAPAILKPSIVFRAVTWEAKPDGLTISRTAPQMDEVSSTAGGVEATGVPTTLSPRAAAPSPVATELVPTARIAFGLRLTPANPETHASGSSISEPQHGRPQLSTPATSSVDVESKGVQQQIDVVSASNDANRDGSGGSSPALADAELPIPATAIGVVVPAPPLGRVQDSNLPARDRILNPDQQAAWPQANPSDGRVDARPDKTPTTNAAPAPVASPQAPTRHGMNTSDIPVQQESGGQSILTVAIEPQASNRDRTPVPDPHPFAANVSIRSDSLAYQQTPPADGERKAGSEHTSPSTPADHHDAEPTRTPAVDQVVPPKTQQQKQVDQPDSGGPVPRVIRSQAGDRRDMAAPNRNAGRGNPGTFEPQAQPAQGPATLNTRVASSAGDTPHAAKVVVEPEINVAARPQPTRQISLKLGADSTKVDVELTERAGKVLVAVRTPDRDLAKSLQTDLGELVGRLENKGFKTEAWIPTASGHSAASAPSQSGPGNSPGEERHSGSGAGQQQGRQGQNGSNQRQQARWVAQVEETLSTGDTRMEQE